MAEGTDTPEESSKISNESNDFWQTMRLELESVPIDVPPLKQETSKGGEATEKINGVDLYFKAKEVLENIPQLVEADRSEASRHKEGRYGRIYNKVGPITFGGVGTLPNGEKLRAYIISAQEARYGIREVGADLSKRHKVGYHIAVPQPGDNVDYNVQETDFSDAIVVELTTPEGMEERLWLNVVRHENADTIDPSRPIRSSSVDSFVKYTSPDGRDFHDRYESQTRVEAKNFIEKLNQYSVPGTNIPKPSYLAGI